MNSVNNNVKDKKSKEFQGPSEDFSKNGNENSNDKNPS
jgi:hypothetical protein